MYENFSSSQQQLDTEAGLNSYVSKIFARMFLGLLVTAFAALITATNETILTFLYTTPIMFVFIIAELIIVFSLSARVTKISFGTAKILFYLYALINGVTLSSIFLVYNLGTISTAFFTSAMAFGVMAVYGMVTKKDLTKIGSIFLMFLIGIIIASIINMFLKSSGLELIISFIAVGIFTGLVAFDTQKLKSFYYSSIGNSEYQNKIGVIGALSLYLDFINIFLYVLRIFNNKK
ncbi:MAG: Bax inhibitor-1/YccA family protein [Clostridia bacterium]|nr:Bax inhibitor-1/YccA family protein [Clostridia bacterium]